MKYIAVPVLFIVGLILWYLWKKHETAITDEVKKVSGTFSGGASGGSTASPAVPVAPTPAPVQAPTANPDTRRFYPFGSGGFYFDDRKNPVLNGVQMLSYTPAFARGSFHCIN